MLFVNVVFARHKGKKCMYVNVFVKNIDVSRMVERLGESEETYYLCYNRNSFNFSSEFSNKSVFVGKL